jgi:hypothetical protein
MEEDLKRAVYKIDDCQAEPKKAKRFNTGKTEFFDLPLLALAEVAKVGTFGRVKYGKYNWKEGASASQYFDCRFRHDLKYWYGEDLDDESKCHHLAHAAWNALAELEKILTGTHIDDRYKDYPSEVVDKIADMFKLNPDQMEAVNKRSEENGVK